MFRFSWIAPLVVLALLAAPVHAQTRIGVVDLRQALFSSEGARKFSEQLQQEFADEEARVRSAQEEARRMQQRLERDGAMMNENERQRAMEQFQEKAQEFNFLKQRLDATVNNRKQQFLEQARPDVDRAVRELLEENNLDIILPAEAVVYAKPDMDLTPKLLEKLNK